MIPYKDLFQPDAEFTFLERTFHREMNGGYERWTFKVNGREYLFNGDIRYLSEFNENVIIVNFLINRAVDGLAIWEYQTAPDNDTQKVLGCLIEIVDKALQFRNFKYVATLSSPEWAITSYNFLKSICAPVSEPVASEILSFISPDLQKTIDMEGHSLDAGDLSVNPSYKSP